MQVTMTQSISTEPVGFELKETMLIQFYNENRKKKKKEEKQKRISHERWRDCLTFGLLVTSMSQIVGNYGFVKNRKQSLTKRKTGEEFFFSIIIVMGTDFLLFLCMIRWERTKILCRLLLEKKRFYICQKPFLPFLENFSIKSKRGNIKVRTIFNHSVFQMAN